MISPRSVKLRIFGFDPRNASLSDTARRGEVNISKMFQEYWENYTGLDANFRLVLFIEGRRYTGFGVDP